MSERAVRVIVSQRIANSPTLTKRFDSRHTRGPEPERRHARVRSLLRRKDHPLFGRHVLPPLRIFHRHETTTRLGAERAHGLESRLGCICIRRRSLVRESGATRLQ